MKGNTCLGNSVSVHHNHISEGNRYEFRTDVEEDGRLVWEFMEDAEEDVPFTQGIMEDVKIKKEIVIILSLSMKPRLPRHP